jgi:hypothetical protein
MTTQAKRTRAAVYTLLALLAVLLPMTGWFARGVTATHAIPSQNQTYPRSLRPYVSCERDDSIQCARYVKTVYVTRDDHVRH